MTIARARKPAPYRMEPLVSALFEPCTLRSLTIPNRVWMAPMCQYSAEAFGPDAGVPGDWHFTHCAARAAGGTGLILVEATAVSPEGRISPADLGIWNDTQAQGFRRITAFLESQGTVPGIQLAHAGRKASTDRPWNGGAPVGPEDHGWRPLGPSPIPFDERYAVPDELTGEQITERAFRGRRPPRTGRRLPGGGDPRRPRLSDR
ncbi:hypothetical protein GCM10010381_22310 [Streptomyces xantholiticus]|nr:hypothetical protein GCM10010381_22310 [Streptomyces xantholiticus]